ncbi:transposase [Streptomyces iranensis]|uniref:transposase n=1 Tax=Streptomyces iranensis TaxID=576784 RepID=UPI0039B77C1A
MSLLTCPSPPSSTRLHPLLDAIRYPVAAGISWRAMPADFPGWGRVYALFPRWREGRRDANGTS